MKRDRLQMGVYVKLQNISSLIQDLVSTTDSSNSSFCCGKLTKTNETSWPFLYFYVASILVYIDSHPILIKVNIIKGILSKQAKTKIPGTS